MLDGPASRAAASTPIAATRAQPIVTISRRRSATARDVNSPAGRRGWRQGVRAWMRAAATACRASTSSAPG
ncbi:MAG: hypothetical protein J2P32_10800, partial [Actinobacteria bacterium]|nr:hypothetical protein [Actinomycetota bacterium]